MPISKEEIRKILQTPRAIDKVKYINGVQYPLSSQARDLRIFLYNFYGFSILDKVGSCPIVVHWCNYLQGSRFTTEMSMQGFVSYMERALMQILMTRKDLTRYVSNRI